jgi:hypothetical protein
VVGLPCKPPVLGHVEEKVKVIVHRRQRAVEAAALLVALLVVACVVGGDAVEVDVIGHPIGRHVDAIAHVPVLLADRGGGELDPVEHVGGADEIGAGGHVGIAQPVRRVGLLAVGQEHGVGRGVGASA